MEKNDTFRMRVALEKDIEQIRDVWVTSIRDVCGPDYGNDPQILGKWLESKTIENMGSILANRAMFCIVAVTSSDDIVGVGILHSDGRILACYVSPESLKRGVGRKIIDTLEEKSLMQGMKELTLSSTITARPFYGRLGYRLTGPSFLFQGFIKAFPMQKILAAPYGIYLLERTPSPEAYLRLRQAVGWLPVNKRTVADGLENSLYAVCAYENEEMVGCARIVGDSSLYFYIQDVIVHPRHQRHHVGERMMQVLMDFIASRAREGSVVGLMAPTITLPFFEKFGFIAGLPDHMGLCRMWK